MVTQVITCYHCNSENIVKNGKAPNGKQKYLCHDCSRQSRENPDSNAYAPQRREEILRAYQERSSLRGLARSFGVSPNTVARWLKKAARLAPVSRTLPPAPPSDDLVLELDELWSFVGKKANKRWVWIALARHTLQVVAYAIGERGERTCWRLWERIPESYKGGYCYSDFWEAYRAVIPEERHEAMGKESGELAHVERWNNTLGQGLARFVRKTLSFSKSEEMHEVCVKLFVHRYNADIIPR
jgi:insertion element IS1 protein InsB